jgi:hypothetical protein
LLKQHSPSQTAFAGVVAAATASLFLFKQHSPSQAGVSVFAATAVSLLGKLLSQQTPVSWQLPEQWSSAAGFIVVDVVVAGVAAATGVVSA